MVLLGQVSTLKPSGPLGIGMEPRDLSTHSVYRAGRGIEEVARELGLDPEEMVKLASNENMFGPSPLAIDAIRNSAERVHSYPKASHTDLVDQIAEMWELDTAQVWLGNGGDGALDCIARAMLAPDDTVLVPSPGFAYYAMSARYHHGRVEEYPLSKADDFEQTADAVLEAYDGERIVYLTSPHNPTGSEIPSEEVRTIAQETDPETLVLVDEAYGEFTERPSKRPLLADRDDVAILRTFSKAYGLAGVRLGYALVPESWADAYARINTPFSASELACRAGLAALEDEDHVERSVETAAWAREYIYDELAAPTWESAGNFVLAEVGDASAVADEAQEHGVIIRDCSSFGLPECIRITCGTKEDTRQAVSVLNDVIEVVTA
jgi:histidinol-phosphate aminotransferase